MINGIARSRIDIGRLLTVFNSFIGNATKLPAVPFDMGCNNLHFARACPAYMLLPVDAACYVACIYSAIARMSCDVYRSAASLEGGLTTRICRVLQQIRLLQLIQAVDNTGSATRRRHDELIFWQKKSCTAGAVGSLRESATRTIL